MEWKTKEAKHKCYAGKMIFFSAALDLLQECEGDWNNAQVGVKANLQMRLDYLLVALQQVLSFFRINSAALNEMMGNI